MYFNICYNAMAVDKVLCLMNTNWWHISSSGFREHFGNDNYI